MLRITVILVACAVLLTAIPRPAFAYMDPGSGSFVVQMIIAGLVGASVTIKMYWHRLKGIFGGGSKVEDDDLDE